MVNRGIVLSGGPPVAPVKKVRRAKKVATAPVVPQAKVERFGDLVGYTLTQVAVTDADETIVFTLADGRRFKLYHDQDCCEQVRIESIVGDVNDLVGHPLLFADESSENQTDGQYGESCTWTFYRMGTIKGGVVVRWVGSSNGYYSESVNFAEV